MKVKEIYPSSQNEAVQSDPGHRLTRSSRSEMNSTRSTCFRLAGETCVVADMFNGRSNYQASYPPVQNENYVLRQRMKSDHERKRIEEILYRGTPLQASSPSTHMYATPRLCMTDLHAGLGKITRAPHWLLPPIFGFNMCSVASVAPYTKSRLADTRR